MDESLKKNNEILRKPKLRNRDGIEKDEGKEKRLRSVAVKGDATEEKVSLLGEDDAMYTFRIIIDLPNRTMKNIEGMSKLKEG